MSDKEDLTPSALSEAARAEQWRRETQLIGDITFSGGKGGDNGGNGGAVILQGAGGLINAILPLAAEEIRAMEREACAAIADGIASDTAQEIAAAIRERGQK